jgi:folate-binding protein YgfZ
MSFKPSPSIRLPHLGVLALSGPDALVFAQAQFMNDLRPLAVGRWQWNGWLSAKGRVQALFVLLRTGEQALHAVVAGDDDAHAALAAALQRFVFRAKVTIAIERSLVVSGRFRNDDAAPEPHLDHTLSPLGDGGHALWLDGEPARELMLSRQHAPVDPEFVHRWRLADIAQGIPILEGDQVDAWTPHMLSLQRLDAFSVKKGCYPGQEIVARTHFLGQAKRALAHVTSAAPMQAGSEIVCDGRVIGSVVCTERGEHGFEGLAVLPAPLPPHATLAGAPLTLTPLDAGPASSA